uniref:Secreted protein n=1 Tax=Trichogramma kaykai TaxID=54128 RepID=A0ABD2WBJ4_9HYME
MRRTCTLCFFYLGKQNKSLRRLLHTLFFATPRAYNNAALFFFPLLLFSSCLPYNSSSTTASEYIYTRGRGKKKESSKQQVAI